MRITVSSLLAATALIALAAATHAQELGLADIHDQRVEGGRVCMTDHFHYGVSNGQPTRKAAEAAALQSWVDFTALEYGSAWASTRIAGSRGMRCAQSGSTWKCDFQARPCRLGGRVRSAKRPQKR